MENTMYSNVEIYDPKVHDIQVTSNRMGYIVMFSQKEQEIFLLNPAMEICLWGHDVLNFLRVWARKQYKKTLKFLAG